MYCPAVMKSKGNKITLYKVTAFFKLTPFIERNSFHKKVCIFMTCNISVQKDDKTMINWNYFHVNFTLLMMQLHGCLSLSSKVDVGVLVVLNFFPVNSLLYLHVCLQMHNLSDVTVILLQFINFPVMQSWQRTLLVLTSFPIYTFTPYWYPNHHNCL